MKAALGLALALTASGCDTAWFGTIPDPPDAAASWGYQTLLTIDNGEIWRWFNATAIQFQQSRPSVQCSAPDGSDIRLSLGDMRVLYSRAFRRFLEWELTYPTGPSILGPGAWCATVISDDGTASILQHSRVLTPAAHIDHPDIGMSDSTLWVSNGEQEPGTFTIESYSVPAGLLAGAWGGVSFQVNPPTSGQWHPSQTLNNYGPVLLTFDPDSSTLVMAYSLTPPSPFLPPSLLYTAIALPGIPLSNPVLPICTQANGDAVECFANEIAQGSVWDDAHGRLVLAVTVADSAGALEAWLVLLSEPTYTNPTPTFLGAHRIVAGKAYAFFPAVAPNGKGQFTWVANAMDQNGTPELWGGAWDPAGVTTTEHRIAAPGVSIGQYVQRLYPGGPRRFGDYNSCAPSPISGAVCLGHVPAADGQHLMPYVESL